MHYLSNTADDMFDHSYSGEEGVYKVGAWIQKGVEINTVWVQLQPRSHWMQYT